VLNLAICPNRGLMHSERKNYLWISNDVFGSH